MTPNKPPLEGRCPEGAEGWQSIDTFHPSVAYGDSSPQGEP